MIDENENNAAMSAVQRIEYVGKIRRAQEEIKERVPEQMSHWPEDVRAVANELARCSLFSARNPRSPRLHYSNTRLFSIGKDAKITYTGEELRALDQGVWLTAIHKARRLKGNQLVFSMSNIEICKLNGWEPKQSYYTEIYRSFQRLKATSLNVRSKRLVMAVACGRARANNAPPEELAQLYEKLAAYDRGEVPDDDDGDGLMLSLIGSAVYSGGKGRAVNNIPQGNLTWEIVIEPEMAMLFAQPFLTFLGQPLRESLSWSARVLLTYYASHAKPFDVLISTLAEYLKLDGEFKANRRTVLRALDELVEAGFLLEATPNEDRGDTTVKVLRAKYAPENDAPLPGE
jgi:hypothetical protein